MYLISVLVFAALSTSISKINCTEIEHTLARRFRDVAQALNYASENLPARITNDEKCKIYALISSIAISERSPTLSTISSVLKMDKVELNKHYEGMNIDRIIHVYMNAIDRYRITQLAPAFIELIECLKPIVSTTVNAYLNNPELVTILDLYKQVLGIPGTKIDPNSLDLTQFSQAFRNSLINLFKENFEIFRQSHSNIAGNNINSELQKTQTRRQQYVSQRRERSRLMNQRCRIINPEGTRRYQNEQRRAARRHDRLVLSQEFDTPEGAAIKRQALQRRERVNELRRLRRERLRDTQRKQKLQKEFLVLAEGGRPNLLPTLSKSGRFKDIAQAVNFLKANLPKNISVEEQCKRYAVLSDMALSVKFPHEQSVLDVARLEKDILNEHYDKLSDDRISYGLMSVVDRYRVTQLAPPMMDVIECLRKLDTPLALAYLNNEETIFITDLYKQVLEHPGKGIDVNTLNLDKIRPELGRIVTKLFAQYLDPNSIRSANFVTSNLISRRTDPIDTTVLSTSDPQSLGELLKEQRLDRRREMARLMQKRRRMMYPELQAQNRSAQKDRREISKRKRESAAKYNEIQPRHPTIEPQDRQSAKRRRPLKQVLREQQAEQHEHPNLTQVEQTTNQRAHEQELSQPQERQPGLQVLSDSPQTPQQLPLFPGAPRIEQEEVHEHRRMQPPTTGYSQPADSASSPSTFLRIVRSLISGDRQDRDRLFKGKSSAHTNQVMNSQGNLPSGPGTLLREDPLGDVKNNAFIMQYLSDKPRTSGATINPSAAIPVEDCDPDLAQSGTEK